jgi:hypothetical protein
LSVGAAIAGSAVASANLPGDNRVTTAGGAYLGRGAAIDAAVEEFAAAYGDQTDHLASRAAIADGWLG